MAFLGQRDLGPSHGLWHAHAAAHAPGMIAASPPTVDFNAATARFQPATGHANLIEASVIFDGARLESGVVRVLFVRWLHTLPA